MTTSKKVREITPDLIISKLKLLIEELKNRKREYQSELSKLSLELSNIYTSLDIGEIRRNTLLKFLREINTELTKLKTNLRKHHFLSENINLLLTIKERALNVEVIRNKLRSSTLGVLLGIFAFVLGYSCYIGIAVNIPLSTRDFIICFLGLLATPSIYLFVNYVKWLNYRTMLKLSKKRFSR